MCWDDSCCPMNTGADVGGVGNRRDVAAPVVAVVEVLDSTAGQIVHCAVEQPACPLLVRVSDEDPLRTRRRTQLKLANLAQGGVIGRKQVSGLAGQFVVEAKAAGGVGPPSPRYSLLDRGRT